ncbi:MAG: aldo/keto reductase, partial [Elusimicrobia bacterium]|nr:aldo/keto reductase [Elusimicrobiota bacterium]
MELTRLAGGPSVSRIGLGCEPLGGTDWGDVDERAAMGAVQAALETGVSLFDTADVYGLGLSEERLSQALGARRHDAFIVTKFGLRWSIPPGGGRAEVSRDASPQRVVEALEGSLRRLRIDAVPLFLLHWPDPATPLEATMEALARCVSTGKVRGVGLSNFGSDGIQKAHALLPLTAVECEYSLVKREAETEVLPLCRRLGIGVLAYGPLAQGLLTGKYGAGSSFGRRDRRSRLPHFESAAVARSGPLLEGLRSAAERLGKTPAQVAL